jgi:hypothetical protein
VAEQTGSRRRARTILVIVLIAGFIGAGSALWPWLTGSSAGPGATAPTAGASVTVAPQASPLSSDEARAEYYRLHPKSTGRWQWLLIGGLLALLVTIGVVLVRAPPKDRDSQES